jgi:hypothetical protein
MSSAALKIRRTEKTAASARKPRRSPRRAVRIVAGAVGGVGCSVLALSVWHCTEALSALTGSPLFLSALLAVGIDAGMVACEVATVVCDGQAKKTAERFIVLAVALSVVLNATASAAHATGLMVGAAAAVGGVIPVLVYLLGRVAAYAWQQGGK